jgi:hypothetical protein
LLPVKPHGLGLHDPLPPAYAKVFIIELDAVFSCRLKGDSLDQVMLLVLAVEKRGGEHTELSFPGGNGGGIQSHPITMLASLGPFARDTEKERIKVVSIAMVMDLKTHP